MSAAATRNPDGGGVFRAIRSFVAGTFTRNLAAKVAALVLAMLVWFTVRQDLTEKVDQRVLARVEMEPGLMLTSEPPAYVTVKFEGPASEFERARRNDRAEIILRIRPGDLAGQTSAALVFAPERGNIEHPLGSDVRILSMDPPSVTLGVAVRGRAQVEVARPRIDLSLPQWKVDVFDLVTTKVWLTGPQAVLSETTVVVPPAVNADEILDGVDDETYGPIQRALPLPPALVERKVTLEPGEKIEYRASFVRSGTPQEFDIPFVVYFENPDSPVTLVVNETPRLRKREDGFVLPLTFTGTPTNLARLAEAIKAGQVRTYVRAEDFAPYQRGEVGQTGYPSRVHLELPDELWGKVVPRPPDPQAIYLETKAK